MVGVRMRMVGVRMVGNDGGVMMVGVMMVGDDAVGVRMVG